MTFSSDYEALKNLSFRASLFEGINMLLEWDQETYMPQDATSIRAEQRTLLSEMSHSIRTSSEYSQLVERLAHNKQASLEEKANLKSWHRDYEKNKKLPLEFVREFTETTSKAMASWQDAKKNNDFTLFAPSLEKIVELVRKKADLIGYKDHPYDALIDDYEPNCTTCELDELFSKIKAPISDLFQNASKRYESIKKSDIDSKLTSSEQIDLCRSLLQWIGFDLHKGRLDLSSHPFCSSYHPTDCRLTTRKESQGLFSQLLSTLHELGHGLYDLGLQEKNYGTPLGLYCSLGIHESQSRFWETRIGMSKPFWKFLLPKMKELYPKDFSSYSVDDVYTELNRVEPSFIRTESDELSYPLHIILRYEIEKELVCGKLNVFEIPERWNEYMKKFFNITPPSDAKGCLQDIHWSMGFFGYFPTYTLGNIFGAQLFSSFEKEFSDWEKKVALGQFDFIKSYLLEKIWKWGRFYDSKELVQTASNMPLSSEYYLEYLRKKYSD